MPLVVPFRNSGAGIPTGYSLAIAKAVGPAHSFVPQGFFPGMPQSTQGGRFVYVVDTATRRVWEYHNPDLDPTTMVYSGFNLNMPTIQPLSHAINLNESRIYIGRSSAGQIIRFNFGVPGRIETATPAGELFVLPGGIGIFSLTTGNPDINGVEQTIYASDQTSRIFQIDLAVPGEITTASLTSVFDPGLGSLDPMLSFTTDGRQMFLMVGAVIRIWNLSIPWQITTASPASENFDLSPFISGQLAGNFSQSNGEVFYATSFTNRTIRQFGTSFLRPG